MEVYGTVLCRAELEGVSSDIILNVSHAPDSPSIPLDQLTIHPCVLSADSMPLPGKQCCFTAHEATGADVNFKKKSFLVQCLEESVI